MTSRWLSSILALALLCGSTSSKDWPIFRGNSLQTGVAQAQLPDKLEILWQYKTNESIESAAAIVGDTVYFGSLDEHLYAVKLANGNFKWKYKGGAFKAPPSVNNGAVYIGDEEGIFHCVNAGSGKKNWTYATGADIVSGANFTGDLVLFGSGDEHLYCLTKAGTLKWKFKVPGGPVMASPSIVGNRTFVAGCDSNLHIIDITKGTGVGAVDIGGQAGATSAIDGDQLYVGTMTNQVQAINWKKPQILWTYEAEKRQQAFYSSAAVTKDMIVVGSRDKLVHAISRKTGKNAWSFPTKGKVDSSPVIVNKRVYVGSHDGHLYVLDLVEGKLIQKVNLKNELVASPAISGNRLIIGTRSGVLYCLGKK